MVSHERVLDIGCGKSSHLDIYNKGGPPVVGLDQRLDFLQARQNMHENGVYLVADAQNLPFAKDAFATAYCTSSLEHTTQPAAVLSEAYRTLEPGGRLILDVPHPRYESIMDKITAADGRYHHGLHQNLFTPEAIKDLVEHAGFEVSEFSTRMWKSALSIVVRWFSARLRGQLLFDYDSGELLLRPLERKTRFGNFIDNLLWLSENKNASPKRYYLLSPLRWPNLLFPWVTYLEATKPDR